MKRDYCKELTKDFLIKEFKITNVSPDGKEIYGVKKQLTPKKVPSGKKGKYYWALTRFGLTLGVHRIVWV